MSCLQVKEGHQTYVEKIQQEHTEHIKWVKILFTDALAGGLNETQPQALAVSSLCFHGQEFPTLRVVYNSCYYCSWACRQSFLWVSTLENDLLAAGTCNKSNFGEKQPSRLNTRVARDPDNTRGRCHPSLVCSTRVIQASRETRRKPASRVVWVSRDACITPALLFFVEMSDCS